MIEQSSPDDGWTSCPAGTLGGMARRQRNKRTLRRVIPVAAVACLVGIGMWAALWNPSPPAVLPSGPVDYFYGGIACSEVVPLLDDLAEGKLNAETRQKVEEHLSMCEKCRLTQERQAHSAAAHTHSHHGTGTLGAHSFYTLAEAK